MGSWEHIKSGKLPRDNALGFFCWGTSLKIHMEIEGELFAKIRNIFFVKFLTFGGKMK
jgi:hypothetical protein